MTPLHEAAAAGQLLAVKELLKERGGSAAARIEDIEGNKPIDLARMVSGDGRRGGGGG
jgi:ankyrin repeat protein